MQRTSKTKSVLFKSKSNNKNDSFDKTFVMSKQNFWQLSDKNKNLKINETSIKVRSKKKSKLSKSRYASNQQLKICYLPRKSSLVNKRTNTSPNNQTINDINKKAQQIHKKKYKSQLTHYIDLNKQTM
jgi:hypothetical protein